MYLSQFLADVEERYSDPVNYQSVYDISNSDMAKQAACYIVRLIREGFEVFDFIELIYTENSYYEFNSGLNVGRSEKEIPF